MKQEKKKIITYWLLTILLYAFLLYRIQISLSPISAIRISVFSSLFLFGLEIKSICRLSKSIFTPCLIYLALYYFFQNGLFLLLAIDENFSSNYLRKFSEYIVKATLFSSLSNVIAGYACIVIMLLSKKKKQLSKVDTYNPEVVANRAFCAFLLSGIVAMPLVLLKFNVARVGGYHAVRAYEESIPFFLNFIEYFFVPFAILTLLYNNNVRQMVLFVTLVWLLLTSYCVDRTVGLSGILIVSFITLLKNNSKGPSKKNIVFFSLIIIGLLVLVQGISIVRNQRDISAMGEEGPLMHFVSELGFSSVSLLMMMDIVPQSENYLGGIGYLSSFISGLVPANADPTGIVSSIIEYRRISNGWIEDYYNFTFGLGFSLNAEAYINFGWLGLFPLFGIHLIVFYFLNFSNSKRVPSLFDQYTSFVLLFLWCTLPRRDSYYLWKALVYSILFVKLYLHVFVGRRQKLCLKKQGHITL